MNTLQLILLIGAAIALCTTAILVLNHHHRQQEELVRRIRSTDLYAHLYPLLLRCNKRCVESITVRPEAVCIRLYRPTGRTLNYTFEKHGFDTLEPAALYALAQAIAVDLSLLRDRACYTFTRRIERLDNGDTLRWYSYMITTEYKDSMNRAEYFDKKRP